MANGFMPDTTPPGTAPMPLQQPLPAPKPPSGPKMPRMGGGMKKPLNQKQKRMLAIKKRQGVK